MNIIYYYCYLFYTKVIPDNQPHSTVIFSLSLMESFIINGLISSISIVFFCYDISKWMMIGVLIALLLMNYQFYYKSQKMYDIVSAKPKFFNNNLVSVIICIAFFIFSLSTIIMAPFYVKYLLENYCG